MSDRVQGGHTGHNGGAAVHANAPSAVAGEPEQPKRRRRTGQRSASSAKPVFLVLQALDEDGQPVQVDKSRIKLLSIERNSDKVLEMVDGGTHPNAFYLRGMLQPVR